ncbi:MAG: hybrid sensor histidine kinase/response regulator, partial [Moraxellaceae bacterium]|nr:hybrid sensor histidine kinase/response regulator [Moraxellaceae bacterium]
MSENHSFLALDWVKGEIEETLKQARQALEAFVENPEDAAQMRFCLAYLHQVHGTLQIVEFYGAALLAEEMEKLCQALINGQVARVAEGQEVLMRAILQLPPYLDRVKQSRRDLPVVLLPLMNDMRATRGEPLLSETALFTPDLDAGERAPIQVAPATATDAGLLKKIRQVYQLSLLGFIRNENLSDNLKKMSQVFARLESTAGASPIRELWQVGAAIVEGLQHQSVEVSTAIKMLLGQIDRQLRLSIEDGGIKVPTELLKNLLYYVAKSGGATPRLQAVKALYKLDEALPGEALVNDERARMNGPDREAMKSVVDALCEELARVKDALDLFVRKSDAEKNIADLTSQVPVLKQVADTVAVLGLGQPRRILQEQIDAIEGFARDGVNPVDGTLLDIAGALLYVEATLTGMVAEKPLGQQRAAANEFSASDQLSEAQSAVLRESRSALEKAKDAIIEYIASQWNPTHLQAIPELIDMVRGSLFILQLSRPAEILAGARRYVSERLLAGQHRPDWQEMDTLADVITSVEYYLERVANDAHGGDNILDIAERGLGKLGYGNDGAAAGGAAENPTEPARGTESEWQVQDEDSLEAEMAEAVAPPAQDLPVEVREDEVLIASTDETVMRPVPDELKEMQERLHVGNFGDVALDDDNAELITADFDDAVELAPAGVAGATDALDEDWLAAETAGLGDGGLDDIPALTEAADTVSAALDDETHVRAAASVPPEAAADAEDFATLEDVSLEELESAMATGDDAFPELDDALDIEAVAALPDVESGTGAALIEDAEPELLQDEEPELIQDLEPELSGDDEPELLDATISEPEPEPVAAAPVELPKKPLLPVLTQMPEDNHDFDEEIREIFVEEAEEVLQNINEYFPKWAANFDDSESLLEFRRGFHTLKGSGRMVGAKVVGELAWAFETMLNKVRDKVLAPDQVMVNLVSEALAIIPGLVEDFAGRQKPRVDTSPLMAAAEAISRGEKLSAMDVANAAEQAQDSEDEAAEEAESDGGAADDFDALVASLAAEADTLVAEAEAAEATASELDAAPDGLADLASLASADDELEFAERTAEADVPSELAATEVPVTEEAVAVTEEAEPDYEVDPMLLEIFSGEAEMHLDIIEQYLQTVDAERNHFSIPDDVLRALHTLKGSAGMAGIKPVAEVAAPLEHLFKDLRNQVGHARREHLQVLEEGHAFIEYCIADLNQGGKGRLSGKQELIARIRQLDHERLAHLEKEQADKLGGDAVDLTAATQGLVASFMELGLDHVLDAPWELEGWLAAADAAANIETLQQELMRLHKAAAQKDVAPLALLCERLAVVYDRVADHELAAEAVLTDLVAGHEEIVDVFDTLAASQTVQPNEALLARLLELMEQPAAAAPAVPAFSDEPAVVAFEPEVQQSLGELVTAGDEPNWEEPAAMTTVEMVDPELLEIFLEEADEVLDAAQNELDAWRNDSNNTPALAALQRHLHTLKGGARLAEIRALGDLAHELEFLYEGLVDGRYAGTPDLVELLLRCHDRLADMVGELRSSGRCPSGIDLVNAINAYRRDPAAGAAVPGHEAALVPATLADDAAFAPEPEAEFA